MTTFTNKPKSTSVFSTKYKESNPLTTETDEVITTELGEEILIDRLQTTWVNKTKTL